MEILNYHYLRLFWAVVREGGVGRAARILHLTQPTVSKQIRLFEDLIGEPLFLRRSGRLELTEAGRLAFDYAEQIFSLGREFVEVLSGGSAARPGRLRVGVTEELPKLLTHRILEPVLDGPGAPRLVCEEDRTERLLAELAVRDLDLVLADVPMPAHLKVKAFNHLLGESGVSFFARASTARKLRGGFPGSLDGAPMLVPTEDSVLRRSLERWWVERGLRPLVVAEVHDSALLKHFGRAGSGVFAGATVIEREIRRDYGVEVVGRTQEIRESFYAITIERRVTHPVVARITENARKRVFGSGETLRSRASRSR